MKQDGDGVDSPVIWERVDNGCNHLNEYIPLIQNEVLDYSCFLLLKELDHSVSESLNSGAAFSK